MTKSNKVKIPRLTCELSARQKSLGLTDAKFVRKLGISLDTWKSLKLGRVKYGGRTLGAVMAAFPDLRNQLEFLFVPDEEDSHSAK